MNSFDSSESETSWLGLLSCPPTCTTPEYLTDCDYLEGEASHIAGGEAPQNVATGTSQSGIEPVSGQLGRGEAGEPYDAGNVDGMTNALRAIRYPRVDT